jgi:cytoskeletal protein CcmA (bactofilin family)
MEQVHMAESSNTSTTTTVIGPDTFIKGEMQFDSAAKILGRFEGKLTAKGELHVGQGANCKAAVDAGTIIVDGVIEGNVTARERAKLNASAKVIGDITAKTLIVAEGATFTGRCQVGADAVERSLQQAEEKPLAVETRVTGVRPATAPRIPALAGVNGEAV